MENPPFEDVLRLLKTVIFHCYVSLLPEVPTFLEWVGVPEVNTTWCQRKLWWMYFWRKKVQLTRF